MWKFIDGAKPPTPKRRKLESEQRKEHARAYEVGKRERKWQQSWKTADRNWLIYDSESNEMHCSECREFAVEVLRKGPFVIGTKYFKVESVKDHEASNGHRQCVKTGLAKRAPLGESVADKTLFSLNKMQTKRMGNLFLNAQALAKKGRPFSDFTWQCA